MFVHRGKMRATPGQVLIWGLVISGLFFGSKHLLEFVASNQHQKAVEMTCDDRFDEPIVVDACAEWAFDQFEVCADDPPKTITEAARADDDGNFDPDAPGIEDLCRVEAVDEFARRRGQPVDSTGGPFGEEPADPRPDGTEEVAGDEESRQVDEQSPAGEQAGDDDGFTPTREFEPSRPVRD